MKNKICLKGKVKVTVRDAATGRILKVIETHNLIVAAGKNMVAESLISSTAGNFNYIGVGSSNQTPSESDVDLVSPISPRKQVTERWRSNNVAKYSAFFGTNDNNGTWRESGLFNAATGGTMLARTLFPTEINKDTSKTVTVDWEITVSGG